jgi:sulfite reductase (NADPH) flavoprotein alpha-component
MSVAVELSAYNKDNPFPGLLTENRRLSKEGSEKETRHFVVNIAGGGLNYKVGDSLGIYPTNAAHCVEAVLRALGATGEEPVMLPKAEQPIALRTALSEKLSLSQPTRKVVDALAAKATNPEEKQRLDALLAPEAKEQLVAYLAEREFIDLLEEFPSARLTAQEFVDNLRKLMPRLYSIASSPKLYPHAVHLTIAVVRYRTNNRERIGVCSTYLADRIVTGQTVPVFVANSHFDVPEDNSRDIIMVGPGTGVAPFRAFLQERIARGASGRNWLFFGDQRRASDFLYEEEFLEWQAKGQLHRLDLAFSRDQAHKVYVQNRMLESAPELWEWIRNGAGFYVCGDAKRMAKDVDAALHQVIAEQGGMDAAAAAEYVKAMKKEKRYLRDVY